MSRNRNRISSSKYSLAALTALPRLLMMAGGLCLLLPLSAIADPSPGSACPTNNVYTLTGGPETSGVGGLMVCVSNVWTAVYASDPLGSFGIKNSVSLSGDITPAQLTANTDNWAPTGLATASVIRLSADAARNLTGLTGGVDGRIITLINVGTFTITLKNSATSTAANQFLFTADLALAANETATVMYDSTASRWKLLAKGSASTGGGATDLDGLGDVFTDYVTSNNMIGGRVGAAALANGAAYNTYWGDNAGGSTANSTSTTDENSAFGYRALYNLTSGNRNTGIGHFAGNLITTGTENTAIGTFAMQAANGFSNTMIGVATMENMTSGSSNVALGYRAGESQTSGDANIVIGFDIDLPNAAGSNQLNIGNLIYGSGLDGTNGTLSSGSIGIGTKTPGAKFDNAGSTALSGDIAATISANTNNWAPTGLSGASVIRITTSAASNLTGITGGADGRILTLINNGASTLTLKNNVTSTAANRFQMTADLALAANETATLMYDSTASRWKLLAKGSATAGGGGATDIDGLTDAFAEYVSNDDNLILGRPGAAALTSGVANNIFIGRYAGATSANSATGMNSNIAIGVNPLNNLTTGADNIALGTSALEQNTTGGGNTAIGSALQANTTGSSNVAIGLYTLLSNVSSDQNTAAGSGALMNNTGGANSAFGYSALITHTTGDENTAVGWDAMFYHDTGAGNTALGAYSLANLTSGDNNIAIGILAGEASTAGSKNIIIGHNIDLPSATASNQLNIGNIIYGTGIDGTDGTVSSGNIGIGTKTPGAKLDNAGSTALSGDITPAQLTANTDNWAPTGLSGATLIRMTANAAYNITGLTGGVDGRVIVLMNVDTVDTLTLVANSGSSTAANQFAFSGNLALAPNESATVMYDSTASRWKLLAKGSATGVGDNLGNHIATANVQLNGNWLSGDGGAEGVFVSTFGDVGIGTSSPGANLDVSGTGDVTAIIRSMATNANTFLRFYSRAGGVNQIASIKSGWGGEFSFYPGSDAANAITFQNAAGTTTSLGIDTTNNRVGVGISFPSTTLENAGSTAFSGDITPTALAANTDNWAPTGLATASVIRVSASGAFQLTGITGGVDGRVLTLLNVGANTITLMNDVTSTAANRFLLGANLSVAANQSVTLLYDATASRWRMVAIGSVPAAIPQGTQCGLAKRTVTSGSCLTGAYTSVVTCEGVSIASSCPSGYTWTNWQTGQPPAGGTVYCQAVCFKD